MYRYWQYISDIFNISTHLYCEYAEELNYIRSCKWKCCVCVTADYSSEISQTVSLFMSSHSSWLMDRLQHITDHFDNTYVRMYVPFITVVLCVTYVR